MWDCYERESAGQIVCGMMGEGSPWRQLSAALGFVPRAVSPDELTEWHFAGLVI